MNKNKKKRKGFNATSMRCPYCGSTVVYRSAVNDMHPRNGADYFTRVTLTMAKKGGLNFISGDTIDAGDSE